jgi:hypothetical protein
MLHVLSIWLLVAAFFGAGRAGLGFHPRRLRAAVARGGAYTFGGGNGSRVGSGRSLARIALSV